MNPSHHYKPTTVLSDEFKQTQNAPSIQTMPKPAEGQTAPAATTSIPQISISQKLGGNVQKSPKKSGKSAAWGCEAFSSYIASANPPYDQVYD
jgi:hypothetical protein